VAKGDADVKPVRDERRGRSVVLARLVPALARKAYRARGFAQETVISRWPEIVGRELAEIALPRRLRFRRGARNEGTLEISVESAHATALQHQEPIILARVNGFFGYRAVARIRLIHAPVAARASLPAIADQAKKPDSCSRKRAEMLAKPVEDATLHAILKRWGAEILTAGGSDDDHADSDSPSPGTSG